MTAVLERRYRRLLSWYPADYRAEYADEMLGVLLAGARNDQRYPSPAEAFSIARTATRLRVAGNVRHLRGAEWSGAVAALGLLGPLLLAVAYGARPLAGVLWLLRVHPAALRAAFPVVAWLPAVALLATAVAAACGWRLLAAVIAWAVVAGEALRLGDLYRSEPVTVLHEVPYLALATTVAIALSVPTTRRATTALGRRATALGVAAIALVGLSPAIDPLTARITRTDDGGDVTLWPGSEFAMPLPWTYYRVGLLTVIALATAAVLALLALRRSDGEVRRRLFVLLAPAVALFVLIRYGFAGFAVASSRFDPPVLLVGGQWAALAAVSVATFLVGSSLVRWHERRRRLLLLGAVAEQQSLARKISENFTPR